jgi:hypothetical protein
MVLPEAVLMYILVRVLAAPCRQQRCSRWGGETVGQKERAEKKQELTDASHRSDGAQSAAE